MNVQSYIKAIISLVLIVILTSGPVSLAYASPVTVDTSTRVSASYYQEQGKTFGANNYYWLFYSDGTNLVYHTSSDSISWSDLVIVRACTKGYAFDVGFFPDYNNIYVYYAYANHGDLLFCRGTISLNTIIWGTEETVHTGLSWAYPSLGVCTDGRLIVLSTFLSGGTSYCYGWTTTDNDGSSGWGFTNFAGASSIYPWYSAVVCLTGGKAYALYCLSTPIYGRLFAPSTWYGQDIITAVGHHHFSATSEGNDVHLAYYATTAFTKAYRLRDYDGGGWQDEETIRTMASVYAGISICVDLASGDLYAFWGEREGAPNFYFDVLYSKKPSGGSWAEAVHFATNEPHLAYLSINAFKRVWNNLIGVVWTRGEMSPFTLRYDTLSTIGAWHNIATWNFNLTVRQWTGITSWKLNLNTREWVYVADWIFNLQVPSPEIYFPIGPMLCRLAILVTLNGEPMDKINMTVTGGASNFTFWKMTDLTGQATIWVKKGSYLFYIRHDGYLVEHNISIVKHSKIQFELNSTEYRMIRDWTMEIIQVVSGTACFIGLVALYIYHDQKNLSKQWKKMKSLKGKPKKEIDKKLKGKR